MLSLSQPVWTAAKLMLSVGREQWDSLCCTSHLPALKSSMIALELCNTCALAMLSTRMHGL